MNHCIPLITGGCIESKIRKTFNSTVGPTALGSPCGLNKGSLKSPSISGYRGMLLLEARDIALSILTITAFGQMLFQADSQQSLEVET